MKTATQHACIDLQGHIDRSASEASPVQTATQVEPELQVEPSDLMDTKAFLTTPTVSIDPQDITRRLTMICDVRGLVAST